MPIDLKTTEHFWGHELKIAHGLYPFKIRPNTFGKDSDIGKVLRDPRKTTHIIIMFKAGSAQYPKLADIEDSPAVSQQGGCARACDAKLGTYAVYDVEAAEKDGTVPMTHWVDFDHWPVEFDDKTEKWVGIAGLNTGHRHVRPKAKGERWGDQDPATKEDKDLYDDLLKMVK